MPFKLCIITEFGNTLVSEEIYYIVSERRLLDSIFYVHTPFRVKSSKRHAALMVCGITHKFINLLITSSLVLAKIY